MRETPDSNEWQWLLDNFQPSEHKIDPWPAYVAKIRFKQRFIELLAEHEIVTGQKVVYE